MHFRHFSREFVIGIVGVGGGSGLLIAGAISSAGAAVITANSAKDKLDNLIVSTTLEKINTFNYILDTSNFITIDTNLNILNTSN